MAFIDLAYLALGLGIGVGSSRLFGSKGKEQREDTKREAPIAQPVAAKAPAVLPDSEFDVCALKEQLKQTELAYRLAREMSQFKAGFLARTSHELRSPLSSLIGLHQLILSDLCEDPAEEREFIAQAHASALKLVKLLDEIIAVAKTEHGTASLEIQPLQLAGVFEEVYNLTHLQIANRSLHIQVSPPDPEIYVKADRGRLRQVLVNLVDMAVDAMSEGNIHLSAQSAPASGYAHIWIDAPCPESAWSEPVDLLYSEANPEEQPSKAGHNSTLEKENEKRSRGLNLLMNQVLVEVMQGRLEVVALPPEETSETSAPTNFTRVQCSIPLASTEPA